MTPRDRLDRIWKGAGRRWMISGFFPCKHKGGRADTRRGLARRGAERCWRRPAQPEVSQEGDREGREGGEGELEQPGIHRVERAGDDVDPRQPIKRDEEGEAAPEPR